MRKISFKLKLLTVNKFKILFFRLIALFIISLYTIGIISLFYLMLRIKQMENIVKLIDLNSKSSSFSVKSNNSTTTKINNNERQQFRCCPKTNNKNIDNFVEMKF